MNEIIHNKKDFQAGTKPLFVTGVSLEERELISRAAIKDKRTVASFIRKAATDRAEIIIKADES